jgi:ribonuclease H / adenosylcobalamin/alpha-ribazole phosphatase
MRLSEERLALLGPVKTPFACELVRRLLTVSTVRSVTFVGTFVDFPDLRGISDIDTVVLVDELTPAVWQQCIAAVEGIDGELLGLSNHSVHLNTTFGPLKFDEPGRVIIHLMIYSLAAHRSHVLQSPFTCLDWERSTIRVGPALRDIYPVLGLQPRQLLAARRGLDDYLDDIAAGSIRYRYYQVLGANLQEVTGRQALDRRHQGEYAYHIVRNCVANYAKLRTQRNVRLSTTQLLAFWRDALPRCAVHCDWFLELEKCKRERATDYPPDTVDVTRQFLINLQAELEHTWSRRAVRHQFVRHARTALNNGTFLGQGRDPEILDEPLHPVSDCEIVFASPARRAVATARKIAPGRATRIDSRLHEIDYGELEGLPIAELPARYPELVSAWQRGEDPRFPGGENTAGVVARLKNFLAELPPHPCLVVTHNVVLRCLLGHGLGLEPSTWHRLPVAHGEAIEVLHLDENLYLDLSPSQLASIGDALRKPVL